MAEITRGFSPPNVGVALFEGLEAHFDRTLVLFRREAQERIPCLEHLLREQFFHKLIHVEVLQRYQLRWSQLVIFVIENKPEYF